MVTLNTIVHAFEQVKMSIDGQFCQDGPFFPFIAVVGFENDLVFGNEFDAGRGIEGEGCVQDGASIKITVRTNIGTTARQANPSTELCFCIS
jgi:hypothetical protein